MPRVTVVIPTVSRLGYLREALESVANQTYRDFEVVIGDNSACADYAAAVDELAAFFPDLDISIYHHARDIGMVGNANFLIAAGRSEFWLYLPDDDRLMPNCLKVLVAALDSEPRAGVTFADHLWIDRNGVVDIAATKTNSALYGRVTLRAGFHARDTLFPLALRQVFHLQSMMFRREVICMLGFRESAGPVPDFDLQLRLWRAPMKGAVYCPAALSEYRMHTGQATGQGDRRRTLDTLVHLLKDTAPDTALTLGLYRKRLADAYAGLAICEAETGEGAQARSVARQAMLLAPTSPRVLAAIFLSHAPTVFVCAARSAVDGARAIATKMRPQKGR
jgi:GT2 family glycosyltransferase